MHINLLSRFAFAAIATMVFGAPSGASAGQSAGSADKIFPESESARTADALVLGYRLAEFARATQDARAMIVAAKIVDAIPTKPGADKGKLDRETASEETGTAEETGAAQALTGTVLFAEARVLAKGDPDLTAAIEAAQAEASRGCLCGGALRRTQFIPAKTTWTVRFTARGGEPFVVGTRRDSAVPVALKVFDENGGLVCQDRSGNVTLYCRVNPIWTGPITVQTINYGDRGTGIELVTN